MLEDGDRVEQELRNITEALVRDYQPEKIILFGSRAWGTPHKDSDADLCILKEHNQDPLDEMTRAFGVAVEARRRIAGGLPLDVVVYKPGRFAERLRMGDPFVRRISASGKVLYDAERG